MKGTYEFSGKGPRIVAAVAMALAGVSFLIDSLFICLSCLVQLLQGYGMGRSIVMNFLTSGIVFLFGFSALALFCSILAPNVKWLRICGSVLLIFTAGISFLLGLFNVFMHGFNVPGLVDVFWGLVRFLAIAAVAVGFFFTGKNPWILRITSILFLLCRMVLDLITAISFFTLLNSVSQSWMSLTSAMSLIAFRDIGNSLSFFLLALGFLLFAWLGFRKQTLPEAEAVSVE